MVQPPLPSVFCLSCGHRDGVHRLTEPAGRRSCNDGRCPCGDYVGTPLFGSGSESPRRPG